MVSSTNGSSPDPVREDADTGEQVRSFDVYGRGEDEFVAVKRGFSWPGFLFSAVWAAYHSLWLLALVLVTIVVVARNLTLPWPSSLVVNLALLGVGFLVGLVGNDLRRQRLRKQGWNLVTTVTADGPDAAVATVQKEKNENPEKWQRELELNQRKELGRQFALAAMDGDVDGVKRLLDRGADPNWRSSKGGTVLMAAAQEGHSKIVDLLLAAGSDVNSTSSSGVTALILAAQNGHLDVVTRLVRGGADILAKDSEGGTALALAEESGHAEIAGLLRNELAAAVDGKTAEEPIRGPGPSSGSKHRGHQQERSGTMRRFVLLLFIGLGVLLVASPWVVRLVWSEQVYGGLKTSEWIARLQAPSGKVSVDAAHALGEIGSRPITGLTSTRKKVVSALMESLRKENMQPSDRAQDAEQWLKQIDSWRSSREAFDRLTVGESRLSNLLKEIDVHSRSFALRVADFEKVFSHRFSDSNSAIRGQT